MRYLITNHAQTRLSERFYKCDIDQEALWIVEEAWMKGRLTNDRETQRLFKMGSKRYYGRFMLDYRVFRGFVFVFETKKKTVKLVTLFENNL